MRPTLWTPSRPAGDGAPLGHRRAPVRPGGLHTLPAVLIRLLPAVLASLILAAGAYAVSPSPGGTRVLPDLDQEAPSDLIVTQAGGQFRLGFRSAVRNLGDGPLILSGHRHDRGLETMIADQAIQRDGGTQEVVRGVGRLRYVVSPDHRHWHLLGFEHYELARAGGRTLVRDRKTGFCLGDRYGVPGVAMHAKVYRTSCGLGQPALLGVSEGISVGYGDDYAANLEGQYLPLTGLPNGRYELIHRVNADRRLLERDYGNDAASVLLHLRWRDGVPRITVLASCPDSARCRA
jgi:Lysyl oxidase